MKIYIAHNFSARQELARSIVPYLQSRGHSITSRWIWDHSGDHSNQIGEDWAQKDLNDVDAADAILVFMDQCGNTPGRGKFVEFGYALAKGKKVYALGVDTNCIFVHLPQVLRIVGLEQIVD